MGYPSTDRSVQTLAGLSQSVAVLALLKEAGWTVLQSRDDKGALLEQDSLEDLIDRVTARQIDGR